MQELLQACECTSVVTRVFGPHSSKNEQLFKINY